MGEYFSVARENMVAFGDNFVGLELLRYAGMGVAMGNAPQEVRQWDGPRPPMTGKGSILRCGI